MYDLNLRLNLHSKLEPVEVIGLQHLVLRIPFLWDIMYVTGQSVPGVSKKK